MLTYFQSLGTVLASNPLQLLLVVVSLFILMFLLYTNRATLRFTDSHTSIDVLFGLVAGSVLGALTGVLWATFNPIQLAPGIHLRLFAFLPVVFGLLFGRGVGFLSGYVATFVWAQMSGLFLPFHTPLADAFLVGLTGWIPAWLLRGDKSLEQLLASINEDKKAWYIKSGLVCLFTGLFMSTFVALSLSATIALPFITGFVLIGLASDTPPMVFLSGWVTQMLLKSTKRQWSWIKSF